MRPLIFCAAAFLFSVSGFAQQYADSHYFAPVQMPSDRADDSYAIYSMLLTSGPIEWRNAPRKQWLIEAETMAVPVEHACTWGMDPHNAVQAAPGREAEWNEVLGDYDQHCHERFTLNAGGFHVALPVNLLDEAARKRYRMEESSGRNNAKPLEFPDGAGLQSFSEVYFNSTHTLAAVHQGMWCGSLCGNWSWVVLEKRNGSWHTLPWVHTMGMS